jgi:hypothetical protein
VKTLDLLAKVFVFNSCVHERVQDMTMSVSALQSMILVVAILGMIAVPLLGILFAGGPP